MLVVCLELCFQLIPVEADIVELIYRIFSSLGFGFELQFELAADKMVVCAALNTGHPFVCITSITSVSAQAHSQEDSNVWTEDASKLSSGGLSVEGLY